VINYNAPARRALVDNIVTTIKKRNETFLHYPFTIIQHWLACRKVEKADLELIRYDRNELMNNVRVARDVFWKLPQDQRDDSLEEIEYYNAIDTWHEHIDVYGEKV
jgi:hypothetical protein